jgi:hypothetical protein
VENSQRAPRISTSIILSNLLDDLPAERVTLGWLAVNLFVYAAICAWLEN